MSLPKVVILGAIRTPIGAIGGGLAPLQAQQLATHAIKALLDTTGVDPELVEYSCMGWVMQDPRSPNLARTAADTHLLKDVIFRQWVSDHGGVYVPITGKNPPNPYLSSLPE